MKRINEGDLVTVRMGSKDLPGQVAIIDRSVSPIEYGVNLDGKPGLEWATRLYLTLVTNDVNEIRQILSRRQEAPITR